MKTDRVPLGPVGKVLAAKENGVIGMCVAFFWPLSGAIDELTVSLRKSTGVIIKLPWSYCRNTTDVERDIFLRQTRK